MMSDAGVATTSGKLDHWNICWVRSLLLLADQKQTDSDANNTCAHTAITMHWPRQTILSMSIGLIERLGFKSLQQRGWRAELVRPFPWWICSSAECNNLVFGRYPDKLMLPSKLSPSSWNTQKNWSWLWHFNHSVNVITCADCHWITNEHSYTHQPLYQAPVTRKVPQIKWSVSVWGCNLTTSSH